MATLYFIRHAKASPATDNYDQLHPSGERQSQLLGEYLGARRQQFDSVFCGPLERQRHTLQLMREAAGAVAVDWPTAVILEGLREVPADVIMRSCLEERVAGDPELQDLMERLDSSDDSVMHDAISRLYEHMMGLWRANELRRPELESSADFRDRVLESFERISAATSAGQEVAVVTSNGVIGCVVDHLHPPGGGPELRFANTSITRIAVDSGRGHVLDQNQTDHLVDPTLLTWL